MKAERALKDHAVDAVVAPDKLREAATRMLQLAIDGKVDWQARRGQKKGPLKLGPQESMMTFENGESPSSPARARAIRRRSSRSRSCRRPPARVATMR